MPRHSLWTGLAVFTIDRGTCRNVGCGKDANAFFTLLSHVKRTTELSSVRASKWLVLYSKPCSSFHVSSTHCRVPFGPIGHVASENDHERPGKARHLSSSNANTSPTQGETDTASPAARDPEPTSSSLHTSSASQPRHTPPLSHIPLGSATVPGSAAVTGIAPPQAAALSSAAAAPHSRATPPLRLTLTPARSPHSQPCGTRPRARTSLTPARTDACLLAHAQTTWRSTLSSRSPSCALSSRPLLPCAASRRSPR